MTWTFLLRIALPCLVTASCVGGDSPHLPNGSTQRPNFVLILADDLGYGDLACFGNQNNRTPHLDQLAREGLKFTDFHSNGPMCSPTRAALLTGLYQHRFGRHFESALSSRAHADTGLPLDVPTLPKALRKAGYATGMYGKWHLGYKPPYVPTSQGFDEFRGLLSGDGDHHSHINRSGDKDWWSGEELEMEEGYTAELITQHGIDFIERHQDQPFFLYIAHLSIHFPWQGPAEPSHRQEGTSYWDLSKLGPHEEGQVKPVVREMVESVDQSVGHIMAALKRLDLDENTLVLFTSDNGGYLQYAGKFQGEISSNGPLRGQKTDVFEGGHRVPTIAHWPGHIQPGSETDALTMTMDLMPTYLELAGLEPSENLDGQTLAPVLFEDKPLQERSVFWRKGKDWAVRRGVWKLVGSEKGTTALYNLDEDIGETMDRAREKPKVVNELSAAFKAWEADVDRGR